MNRIDIEANIREYLYGGSVGSGREPLERYASFDYCFNYFQSFREAGALSKLAGPENLQTSCLQLGFYLASWGMFRGSSHLLTKSASYYSPLIDAIASAESALWEIDAHCYTAPNIDLLLNFSSTIRHVLRGGASDILVSKIMLGVFGNVPAFDTYFKKGFGVAVFGRQPLERIGGFYTDNSDIVDKHRVQTLDFQTGQLTHRTYTRAKVIDMVFFIEGMGQP